MLESAKKRVAAVAVALLVLVGGPLVAPQGAWAASGTISGTVDCTYGNNAEVGVWVNAASGTDNFASWHTNSNGGIDYSYTLSQASSYDLHIGCGGTTSSWGITMYTYPDRFVNGQYYDWVCGWQGSGVGYACVAS